MKNKKKEQERIEKVKVIKELIEYFKEHKQTCDEMIKEGEKQLKKLLKKKI